MYKVLLVDDEQDVINIIEHKVNWEELGFEVIGSASNGAKALEIAETMQPDVVLTDIKMPYIDGLELSKTLKNEFPNIRIIIFTGFDEFEYAKEAIHLEIEEYLLKPVNSDELVKCLKRLKESLDCEHDEKLNVEKLEHYFEESLPLFRMNFFVSLIEGRIPKENIKQYLNSYQIKIKGKYFCCVVIHTSENDVPKDFDPLLLSMSVQKEAIERIGKNWMNETFTYLGNTVMIIETDSKEKINMLTDECDKFCRWGNRIMGANITIGIGRVCDDLYNLKLSFDDAKEAVSYRVILGTKRAINIKEIAPKEHDFSYQFGEPQMHDLLKNINLGNEENIEKEATEVVKKIKENSKTVNQYNLNIMEMLGVFYRFCSNNFLEFSEFLGDIKNPFDVIPKLNEDMLLDWLKTVSVNISQKISNVRISSSRRLIMEATNLVKKNYQNPDFSLDMVCQELGVSNSYFSSTFTKEVGKTFVTYLTDYRMEIAERMILETSEKSYAIASSVGYEDANYFSYVFKKTFGMSPSKYRKTKGEMA